MRIQAAIIALTLIGVVACDPSDNAATIGDAEVDASGGGEVDASLFCDDVTACGEGRTCCGGECGVPCGPDDCAEGFCAAGGCCEAGVCSNDADCIEGAWCTPQGRCVPGCRPDTCPEGQVCNAQRVCVEPGSCETDQPCPADALGACADGRTICPDGPDGLPVCAAGDAREERCDGVDDDCDGALDEAFAELGEPCGDGEGACADAVWTCSEDGRGVVCPGESPEVCDAIDNDCDGSTDEDFPELGAACGDGEGACAAEGVFQCPEDGGDPVCSANEGLPAAERCNGLDDDCDGTVDEVWARRGEACEVGAGVCAREGTLVCDDEGVALRCDALPGEPEDVDVCDGFDNDCDGDVDEAEDGGQQLRPCYDGPDGTRDVGPCAGGRQACVEGAWTPCEGQVVPSAEVCDGLDNDCEGTVDRSDDGAPLVDRCYGGPEGTAGVGRCQAGFASCELGAPGACVEQIVPAREICDGLDNDCNGLVDDAEEGCDCEPGDTRGCYTGPIGTDGIGQCRAGEQLCGVDGWLPCRDEVLPDDETCEGTDQDCDGEVDELPNLGDPCAVGVGACQSPGVVTCQGRGVFCDAAQLFPEFERCDGADNDCDGATDEDFALDEVCAAGIGRCRREGFTACARGGNLACNAQPGEPRGETCNQLDDDCDGVPDEDFGVGGPCFAGLGLCERPGQLRCDDQGGVVCDAEPAEGAAERCDGLDNDCDGRADEGFAIAERCSEGIGACEVNGFTECGPNGELVCDAAPREGRAETCNGFDDDCDGVADEDVAPGGNCITGELGVCRFGRLQCQDGGRVCVANVEAAAEVCDGLDNDCDARIDEELADVPCGQGVCARLLPACTDGAPTACDPNVGAQEVELCNGADDDCDGDVDEQAQGDDAPCGNGEGACQRPGRARCLEGALVCDAVPGEPEPELCDGEDDDCDGTIDEDAAEDGRACSRGVGECRRQGVLRCIDGAAVCSAQPGPPADEICNAVDDDCDGELDEGFGSSVCGEGICRRAVPNCEGGEPPPCIPRDVAVDEVCNGLDDDCDGAVDEDTPGVGRACTGGVGECRRDGLTVCADGVIACGAAPGAPAEERCDNLDNDCDGVSDEDAREAGRACSVGFGACAREGVFACAAGQLACDAQPGAAAPEQCNGVDDDCDGAADEALGTVVCGVGVCRREIAACRAGAPAECDPRRGAVAETCNGFDDDCDGATDEEALGTGAACSAGDGACRAEGERVCLDGLLTCGAEPGDPVLERCNGVDDDCDRRVDERFGVGDACEVGVGACLRQGSIACDVQGDAACDAQPGPPAEEACNGVDDDCDGVTDEAVDGAGDCDTGQDGVCAAGTLVCADGGRQCVPNAAPSDEVCDGLDNDCDGATDEEQPALPCGEGICARDVPSCVDGQPNRCDPTLGAMAETCDGRDEDCDGDVDENAEGDLTPCVDGVGACRRVGIGRCVDAEIRCDAQPFEPQPELCNGVDDDCDGVTDEDSAGAGAPCFVGVGACRNEGALACVEGRLTCPADAGAPAAEVCNGADDDCDGELDEGFGSQVCGLGACRKAVPNCEGGNPPACDPLEGASPERCNGIDDDCDGATDEEVPGLGAACNAGQGLCRRAGFTACRDGGTVCDAQPGQPAAERCDGQDNDCDGVTDESPEGAGDPCVGGEGICARDGARICRFGELRCDARQGVPEQETCNGLDDDCDGTVDDSIPPVMCGQGVCRRQIAGCVDGAPPECDPLQGAADEACNGADDDCDGAIDEDQGDLACGRGECARDIPACLGGVENECDPFQGAGAEVCDALDNDCDGRVDESPLGAGASCRVGVGACRRVGEAECVEGELVCDAQPGEPAIGESCDNVDNDCDGEVDERPEDLEGRTCERGVGGCRVTAPLSCNGGFVECDAQPREPEPEVCDDIDNDCDNAVDEGPNDCDGNGVEDACDVRRLDCNGNGLVDRCDVTSGRSQDCNENLVPDECNDDGRECLEDRRAPEVTIFIVGEVVDPGEAIFIRVDAQDNVAVTRVEAFLDGVPINLNAAREATLRIDEPGAYSVSAEAADAAGNVGTDDRAVLVQAPDDQQFPVVEISAPANAEVIDGPFEVVGTVDDAHLLSWVLSYGPPGDPQRHTLALGDEPVIDGRLGVLDPGEIPPGNYELLLFGQDVNARAATDLVSFNIGECVARPERCDGGDNDCDGAVDEDFPDLGAPCSAGVGACRVDAERVCNAAGDDTECGAVPRAPQPEQCDAVDRDCDGDPRNGFDLGAPCTGGVGACARPGQTTCAVDGAGTVCDAEPGAPRPEQCDNRDDDCDGEVDEDFERVSCGEGACAKTVSECADGVPGGPIECDPLEGAGPEQCNRVDDDCDGATDEQAADVGDACEAGVGECSRPGQTVCADGEEVCGAQPGAPNAEVCNGRDDDCDGATDEGEVCPDLTPPEVQVLFAPDVVPPDTFMDITVVAEDDRGVVELRLEIDGIARPLDTDIYTYEAVEVGRHSVVGIARDEAGNEGRDERTLIVTDPNDAAAPVARITAPAEGADVQGDTAVRGTADDPNLLEYALFYSPAGGGPRTRFARSIEPVVNGLLGTLPAGQLAPGDYVIELFAEDFNGFLSSDSVEVTVLGGAPVQASRRRATLPVDDGRRARRFRRAIDTPVDPAAVRRLDGFADGWQFVGCNAASDQVIEVEADGRTHRFRPELIDTEPLLVGCRARLVFRPVGQGDATLEVIGSDVVRWSPLSPALLDDDIGRRYQPRRFRLRVDGETVRVDARRD